jgi:hypothetical protein
VPHPSSYTKKPYPPIKLRGVITVGEISLCLSVDLHSASVVGARGKCGGSQVFSEGQDRQVSLRSSTLATHTNRNLQATLIEPAEE